MARATGWSVSPTSIDISKLTSTTIYMGIPANKYDPIDWYGYVIYMEVNQYASSGHSEKAVILEGRPPGMGQSGYGSLVNLYPTYSTTLAYAVNMFNPKVGDYIHFWAQAYKRGSNGIWAKDGGMAFSTTSIKITGSAAKTGTAHVKGVQGTDLVTPGGEKNMTLDFSGFNFGSYKVTDWYLYAGSWCLVKSWKPTTQSGSGTQKIDFPSERTVTKGGTTTSVQCELKAYLDNGTNVSYKWTVRYGRKASGGGGYVPPPPPRCSTPSVSLSPSTSDVSNQGNVTLTASWSRITGASNYSIQIVCKGKTVSASTSSTSYSFNLREKFPGVTFAEGDVCYVQVQASGSGYTSSGWGKSGNHTIKRDRGSSPTDGWLIGRRRQRNVIAWRGDRITLHYSGQRDGSYPIEHFELVRIDDETVKKTWKPSEATKGDGDWTVDVSGVGLPGPGESATFEIRAYDTSGDAVYMNGGSSWFRMDVEGYPGLMWIYAEDRKWHEVDIWVFNGYVEPEPEPEPEGPPPDGDPEDLEEPDPEPEPEPAEPVPDWKSVALLWLMAPVDSSDDGSGGEWVAL